MNIKFVAEDNLVEFGNGLVVKCKLYDTPDNLGGDWFHIADAAEYAKIAREKYNCNIAICSICNIEDSASDPAAYKAILDKVIMIIKGLCDNVIFITRASSDDAQAIKFCTENGFVSYNFFSGLQYGDPFIYVDGRIPAYILNLMIESANKTH